MRFYVSVLLEVGEFGFFAAPYSYLNPEISSLSFFKKLGFKLW